jgi:ArsR family metal-binding transcriptional regulator
MVKDNKNADHIARVLRDIQARIPNNLLKNAVREKELTPTINFVMKKALESKTISEKKKEKIRTIIKSGEFSKKTFVDNLKIQEMINNFVAREINKAIKSGLLPPQKDVKDIDFIKEMFNKMKTNE